MQDIIEHYGKIIIAILGMLAAVFMATTVITVTKQRTTEAVNKISYENVLESATETTVSP